MLFFWCIKSIYHSQSDNLKCEGDDDDDDNDNDSIDGMYYDETMSDSDSYHGYGSSSSNLSETFRDSFVEMSRSFSSYISSSRENDDTSSFATSNEVVNDDNGVESTSSYHAMD